MDFNCKYIDKKEGYCKSPEMDDLNLICFCSNYMLCAYFPKQELKRLIEKKEGSNLEKEVRE